MEMRIEILWDGGRWEEMLTTACPLTYCAWLATRPGFAWSVDWGVDMFDDVRIVGELIFMY
jgi:hypothetical protein